MWLSPIRNKTVTHLLTYCSPETIRNVEQALCSNSAWFSIAKFCKMTFWHVVTLHRFVFINNDILMARECDNMIIYACHCRRGTGPIMAIQLWNIKLTTTPYTGYSSTVRNHLARIMSKQTIMWMMIQMKMSSLIIIILRSWRRHVTVVINAAKIVIWWLIISMREICFIFHQNNYY